MKDFSRDIFAPIITLVILLLMALAAGYVGSFLHKNTATPSFGAFNPAGGLTYTLLIPTGSTDTTITLSSFKERAGIPLTMSLLNSDIEYGTLEPQSSNSEFISFTGVTQNSNGTATLTGVNRGLSDIYPFTASSTLAESHSGGSYLILSNTPQFYQEFALRRSAQDITGLWDFSSTSPPFFAGGPGVQATGNYISTTSEFASVAFVQAVAFSGSSNATQTVRGIVQLATGLQAASSTIFGSSGAALVLPASIATDTPNSNTNKSDVLMSDLTGHLTQAWLDLSATATWIFNGAVSIAANSSHKLTINTLAYVFPTTQVASGVLQTDGSGNLSWANAFAKKQFLVNSTGALGSASSTAFSFSIPGGTLGTGSAIQCNLYAYTRLQTTDSGWYDVSYGGTSSTTVGFSQSTGGGVSFASPTQILLYGNGSTGSQVLAVSTLDVNGRIILATSSVAVDSTTAKTFYFVDRQTSSSDQFSGGPVVCVLLP